MGGTQSEDIAEENLQSIASVINLAVQNCGQTLTESQVNNINLTAFKGKQVTINQKESLALKEGCLQSEAATTQLDQALQAAASQTASAISQQLQLSTAKSKNVIKINAQMASEVKNRFVQNCSNQASEQQVTNIQAEGAEIGTLIINQTEYINDLVSCSTQGNVNDALKNNLKTSISQEATAKVENFFTPFFIALVVIVGIIALFLFLPTIFRGRETETRAPAAAAAGGESGIMKLEEEVGAAGGAGAGAGGEAGNGGSSLLESAKGLFAGKGGEGAEAAKGAEGSIASAVEDIA